MCVLFLVRVPECVFRQCRVGAAAAAVVSVSRLPRAVASTGLMIQAEDVLMHCT